MCLSLGCLQKQVSLNCNHLNSIFFFAEKKCVNNVVAKLLCLLQKEVSTGVCTCIPSVVSWAHVLLLAVNFCLQLSCCLCRNSRNLNLKSVQFYQTVVFQQVGLLVRKAVLPSIKSLTETGELINVWLEKKYGVCDLPANYSLCFLDPPKQSMYIPNILS